jgi:predicted ATP-grasp superfamily ATP-dependent carboligase
MKKKILLVNPLSSIEYLVESFKSKDFMVYAIYNQDILQTKLPNYKDFMNRIQSSLASLFDQMFLLTTSDLEPIIAQLKGIEFTYVLNGFEYSSLIADELSRILTPNFVNNSKTSHLRENKFATIEWCNNLKFISTPMQMLVKCEQLKDIEYLNKSVTKFQWPIFCKPASGRGTVGAFKAENFEQLINHLHEINSDDDYIFQEFVDGVEYFVDTVSIHGKHIVAAVGKYTKEYINNTPVYRLSELVNDKNLILKIEQAVNELLNTIELKNGFNHIEIIITKSMHIYLIEINNRISGGNGIYAIMENYVGLKSQDVILAEYLQNMNLPLDMHAWQFDGTIISVDLYKFKSGYLENIPALLTENKIKTMIKYYEWIVAGSYIRQIKRISVFDAAGTVVLFDLNQENVLHDIIKIKEIENKINNNLN